MEFKITNLFITHTFMLTLEVNQEKLSEIQDDIKMFQTVKFTE
ncbi:hypothetical protein [Psychrobacillus sp. FSL K6-1415]